MVKTKQKKERNKKRKKKKDKIHNQMVQIYEKRLKEVEFQFNGKEYELHWEKQKIGIYTAIGIPPSLERIRQDTFKWKNVDVLTRFRTPNKKPHINKRVPKQLWMWGEQFTKRKLYSPC